ncbi:MAG: membrane dipeptidase [Gemmatimonadaceae bacterium]
MTTRREFLHASTALLSLPMINRGRFAVFGPEQATYSARCIALMQRALVIDMLSPLNLSGAIRAKLNANPDSFTAADAVRFRSSGIHVLHAAVGWGGPDAYVEGLQYFLGLNGFVAARDDLFMRIDSAADLARVRTSGKIGVLLGAQNSDHFIRPGFDPRDMLRTVNEFYGYGQRVSQLTYNSQNWFGSGSTERGDNGLSEMGVALIERMNKVGMAVDTAHSGDRTTLDAFATSKKPVLVTHSNVRALNPGHPRCKPDSVIDAVGKAGSVMGITGVRMFVKGTEPTSIDDYLNHIDYVATRIGVEHVGIGSDIDLDGYDDLPAAERDRLKASYAASYGFREKIDIDEIAHPKRMFDVTEGLIRRKYSDDQILGILGLNFQRVLSQIWV